MEIAELFATLGLKPDTKAWQSGSNLIGGVKKALGGLVAAAVVWKGIGMVEDVIDLGGHLNDTSQKIGVSAEALQELGYAAKLNSSSIDDVAGAMTKLGKNIDEALVTGKGPAADALKRLGISLNDPAIKTRNLDKAFMEISDRMSDLPDGPKKIALAMDLLGKSGADLIPTMNNGADGLKEMRKEARDLGGVMSNQTVSGLDDLGDNVDRLKFTLTGLKNQAVAALLPMLSEMATKTLDWVKANQDVIRSSLTAFVNGLATALSIVGTVISTVVEIIDWFGDHMEITKAILIAVGVVLGVLAAEAVVAWLAIAAPVIAVIAAIAAVILVFEDLYHSITEGKGYFADAWRWIVRKFKEFWQQIKNGANEFVETWKAVGQSIKQVFIDVFDWLVKKSEEVADKLKHNVFTDAGHAAGDVLRQMAGKDSLYISDELAAARDTGFTGSQDELDAMKATNMAKRGGMAGGGPHVGGPPAMSDTSRPYNPQAAGVNITNNVTSPNADPKQVADEVSKSFSKQWDGKMVHTFADVGGTPGE